MVRASAARRSRMVETDMAYGAGSSALGTHVRASLPADALLPWAGNGALEKEGGKGREREREEEGRVEKESVRIGELLWVLDDVDEVVPYCMLLRAARTENAEGISWNEDMAECCGCQVSPLSAYALPPRLPVLTCGMGLPGRGGSHYGKLRRHEVCRPK
eukprot:2713504-Rhodomonas_salina.1